MVLLNYIAISRAEKINIMQFESQLRGTVLGSRPFNIEALISQLKRAIAVDSIALSTFTLRL